MSSSSVASGVSSGGQANEANIKVDCLEQVLKITQKGINVEDELYAWALQEITQTLQPNGKFDRENEEAKTERRAHLKNVVHSFVPMCTYISVLQRLAAEIADDCNMYASFPADAIWLMQLILTSGIDGNKCLGWFQRIVEWFGTGELAANSYFQFVSCGFDLRKTSCTQEWVRKLLKRGRQNTNEEDETFESIAAYKRMCKHIESALIRLPLGEDGNQKKSVDAVIDTSSDALLVSVAVEYERLLNEELFADDDERLIRVLGKVPFNSLPIVIRLIIAHSNQRRVVRPTSAADRNNVSSAASL